MDNSYCSAFCSCENEIAMDLGRLEEVVQDVTHLDHLISIIDQRLQAIATKNDRAQENTSTQQVGSSSMFDSCTSFGKDLVVKMLKRAERNRCMVCFKSGYNRETRKVVIEVLKDASEIELLAAGISVVGYLLEQLSYNSDQCVRLLRWLCALARRVKGLDHHIPAEREQLKEAVNFIFEGCVLCLTQVKSHKLSRVFQASVDAGDLRKLESQIQNTYTDLTLEAVIGVSDNTPRFLPPTQGQDPKPVAAGPKRKNEDNNGGPFPEMAPSASTSASTLIQKPCYDVFINHRGPDVKDKLASRIYNILKEMKVAAFLDSEELEYGDFFPATLEAAMRTASLHIAIFSENYAKSSWCLAELSFMLETGAKIIPVFYYVDPTDLRYVAEGKGIYVDAFVQYEEKRRYSPEKLHDWKMALKKASFYTGQIIKNNDDEMRLLKNIVNIVLKEINNVPLVVANHPVGLEETVQDFEMNTLQSAHGDEGVQVVGIWGMGGSGKTTLVKYLYNQKSSFMERSSIIFDVRAAKGMLQNKQIQLLKGLGVNRPFDNIEQGKALLMKHLRSVKVLIVLDDVDHVDQLDALLPVKGSLGGSLGGGSLIIVTTREKEVLRSKGISSVYKMRELDPFYAEQLFCWHAFSQSVPLNGFEELVTKFLEACNGLPLSLKVFGGQISGESRKEHWESLLHKISRILPEDIKDRLKISYDALDHEEKEMFLDTACFFIGEKNSLAIEVWNGSGWSGLHGWEKLLNKCLVELDEDNHIRMHDHLRDLGREIADQHSLYRLWSPQQIINAQKQTEKRNGIRGVIAVSSRIISWHWFYMGHGSYPLMDCSSPVGLDEELVANNSGRNWSLAPHLLGPKIFVSRGDYFNKVMGEASGELVWLRLFQIGQRNLPSGISLKKLRVLELFEDGPLGWEHNLEELWEADSDAPVQLRELVISDCRKFQRLPNSIGRLNVLKKIVITNSYNLRGLPEEFCRLQSLEHLQLVHCWELSSLPTSFGDLRSLRFLGLSECSKLRMLPVSFRKLMFLQHLDLKGCTQLILRSEDFQNITKLEFLDLSECEQLEELPRAITNQASLRELYLDGTERLRELPINIGQLKRLRKMWIGRVWSLTKNKVLLTSLPTSLGDLSSLKILKSLPTSLGDLSFLTNLEISCENLKSLPTSLGDLSSLTNLTISSCNKLKSLPTSLGDLSSLTNLLISNCWSLKSLPTSLGDLTSLMNLSIIHCQSLNCLPSSVERLNLLERLSIYTCPISQVEIGAASLPFAFGNIKHISLQNIELCRISFYEDRYPRLESLYLTNNDQLTEIEALPTTVKSIELTSCKMLKNIRVTGDLVNLESLMIRSCPELDELPSFAHSTSLREFELEDSCYRLQKIEGLEYCTRLEILTVETCSEVPVIRSLENMKKLRGVNLRANKVSAIERCIQTIQKLPGSIQICTRAVPDASSLGHSILSSNLMVVDSSSNHVFDGLGKKIVLTDSSNGDAIMLCFVINCVSSQMQLTISSLKSRSLEKGRWLWVGRFPPQEISYITISNCGEGYGNIVEEGLVVRGEEQSVMEAFHSLLPLLQS